MDLAAVWQMFDNPLDEEDFDEINDELFHREARVKIDNYFENIVYRYSLTDFKSHFRLERETFEALVQDLGERLHNNDTRNQISPDKRIAAALWFFGNQEVYRSVADRFGISKDTLWRCVFQVAMLLTEDAHLHIHWPQMHEIENTAREFQAISGFPGVIGLIDGCHIPISAPTDHPDAYVNRKGFHSILLQGICDPTLKFINIFSGLCGSIHDARAWRLSDIYRSINENHEEYFVNNHYHILGDSAYPLSNYLLTPYRDNGHLIARQKRYNKKLSQTRVGIERAFGILKGRFRKLKYVYMYNTEMIPLVIGACCVLHNICINYDDEPIDIEEPEPEEPEEFQEFDDNVFDDVGAEEKRTIISQLL